MRTAGIVAEYNPFHRGHAWHLAQTRERLGEDAALAVVMSGNFVQRGECAVLDKHTRARAALEGGADLVLELPTVWAASSAEHFAWGAVSLLRAAGADALSFGSESGDVPALLRAARCLRSDRFREALRPLLAEKLPFPVCRQRAAEAVLGKEGAACLTRPNDNLAAEYLKAALALDWIPEVIAVPRAGAGHDEGAHPEFPSASFLRRRMLSGAAAADNPASLLAGERAVLARLRSMSPGAFDALPDGRDGLSRRLGRAAGRAAGLEELYELACTKQYPRARVRRLVLWAFLGLTEADRPERPPYLRVLGLGSRGREVLREMKTRSPLPILTKPAHAGRLDEAGRRLFGLEARCTDLYGLCRPAVSPPGLEWTTGPVIWNKTEEDL